MNGTFIPSVRFDSFNGVNDETRHVDRWKRAIAMTEDRTYDDVAKEFKIKITYAYKHTERPFCFQVYGPQELADRINVALAACGDRV